MERRNYELVLLYPTDITDEERSQIGEIVSSRVQKAGGEVTEERLLFRRKLAYPIRDKSEGLYYILEVSSMGEEFKEISGILKNQDRLLRFAFLKKDKVKSRKKEKKPNKSSPRASRGRGGSRSGGGGAHRRGNREQRRPSAEPAAVASESNSGDDE